MRQVFFGMVVEAKIQCLNPQPLSIPIHALFTPILEPFIIGTRFDEELHFHLLEFTGAEDEIPWCDLVAKRFANLRDPERRFETARLLDIEKVDEHALCGLWSQKRYRRLIFNRSYKGLKHEIELTHISEIALCTLLALAVFFRGNVVCTKTPLTHPTIH